MPPSTPPPSSKTSKKSATGSNKPRAAARRKAKTASASATSPAKALGGIVNYTTAIKWLNTHINYERMRIIPYNERAFGLNRVRKLLGKLDNPHEQVRCVHVAGTKGKGSTCAMLASTLQACGYTVGLYTSPHLIDLRERITIDGQMISHADAAELFKQIAAIEAVLGNQPPSFFEIMTLAALRYFADQAVDVAVLETGLGGRLDATSVVNPLVCGLAHISLDHTNVLGSHIASIAHEKAGIFKPGIPAISVHQEPEVAQVLDAQAQQTNTPLEYTGQQIEFSYRFESNRQMGPHTRVSLTTPTSRWEHLPVPLRGEHQAHNCGLSLAMLDKLKAHDFTIPEDRVALGLAQTTLPGRMEQVWDEPRVVIDGAHNAVSIQALIRALGAYITYDSLVLIFACGQDKDIHGMLKQVSLGADKVIFTRAQSNPRAVEPRELLQRFSDISGKMAQTAPNLEQAIQLAGRAVSRDDLVIITGSFYLAGEAKKYFATLPAKRAK